MAKRLKEVKSSPARKSGAKIGSLSLSHSSFLCNFLLEKIESLFGGSDSGLADCKYFL
jgi:hypothetical protein